MTTHEVRDYLNRYHSRLHSDICYINALQRHVSYYEPYQHIPAIRGYCDYVRSRILAEQEELKKQTQYVWKLAELISDQTRRRIFIDRYIYDEPWEKLQYMHNYSASSIFNIHKKCIAEIARKTKEK